MIGQPLGTARLNRRRSPDPLDRLDPAAREATRWFVALHDDPSDGRAREAFEAWRRSDPANAEAYARLQRLWGASGHLPSLASPDVGSDRRSVLRGAGAVALGGVALLGTGRLVLGAHPLADYRTGTGERRTVALGDGSIAELSTDTALSIAFDANARRVRLLDGEAWFQVSRDPVGRPFIVESARGTATALGTAFAVAADDDGARVTVTEHAVRVDAAGRSTRLEAGQSCRYGTAGPSPPETADTTSLAWRQGRLVFASQPLSDVVRALDRWHPGRTIITDADLAAQPVTLMIDTRDADQALLRLGASLPMRIVQVTPLLTIIRSAN